MSAFKKVQNLYRYKITYIFKWQKKEKVVMHIGITAKYWQTSLRINSGGMVGGDLYRVTHPVFPSLFGKSE